MGIAVMLYPKVGKIWNVGRQSRVVDGYERSVEKLDARKEEKIIAQTRAYNVMLLEQNNPVPNDKNADSYGALLNMTSDGVMGYLEIPCISVNLPIYHGTDAEILERGVGHLAASSIPVGGKSTHSVLTGHTGLSSAKLFTDLTEMKKEDLFFIHVLDRTLAYKVDQISVVRPEDTRKLQIVKGKDYVTLVTCTPYGVNDHRLLVRGVRTKYVKKQRSSIRPRNQDSQWMRTYKKAIAIGLMIVTALILLGKVFQKLHRKKTEHRQINRKKGREE